MDTNLSSAILSLQNPAIQKPQNTMFAAKAEKAAGRVGESQSGQKNFSEAASKAASEFEAMFIGQFLGSMFKDMPTNGLMGGGQGEEMFRSLLIEQYAQNIQKQGGFGLAASVKSHLLKLQNVEPAAVAP